MSFINYSLWKSLGSTPVGGIITRDSNLQNIDYDIIYSLCGAEIRIVQNKHACLQI